MGKCIKVVRNGIALVILLLFYVDRVVQKFYEQNQGKS